MLLQKLYVEALTISSNGIQKWRLWGVTRIGCGHEGGAPMMALVS